METREDYSQIRSVSTACSKRHRRRGSGVDDPTGIPRLSVGPKRIVSPPPRMLIACNTQRQASLHSTSAAKT
jgi:hypothetical protein